MHGEKDNRDHHQARMHQHLSSHVGIAFQYVRVEVSGQQHQLKKQQTRDPNRSGSAQKRQHHFSDHGFAAK